MKPASGPFFLKSFTCVAAAVVAPPLFAQSAGSRGANGDIDQIVVTATRVPDRLDQIGSSVTVLTAADIRARQTAVVSDLLAETPGVTFSRNGGVGGTTSVYIRGAEAGQTVVLIDGVKLTDPSQPDNGFDFSNLLTGDISRIEILRGPQSTLWGSQAIGGVVNIVTASPAKAFEANAQAEGGSYDTVDLRAGLGGKTDQLDWRMAGSLYDTKGVSDFDKAFGGKEPDGYRNLGASGRFTYDIGDQAQLDELVYYLDARSDFDGFPPPNYTFADTDEYGRTTEVVDYSGVNFGLFNGRLSNRVAFQYTYVDRNNYDPSLSVPRTFVGIGSNERLEYQGTWDIAQGYQAIFGAEHERSHITTDSPSPFDPNPVPLKAAATIDSGYGRLQAEVIRGLTLTAGVRYDDHDVYGGHATVQATAAWALNDDNTIFRTSFGQGFKAPALYQLFSDYGNPGLRPEKANGWDAGVEQHFWDKRVTVSATYFGRISRDLINFFSCGGGDPLCATHPFGYYANIARSKADGVELQASAALTPTLTLAGNYTYTDDTDISPGSSTYGKALPRRPQDSANVSLSYLWPFDLTTAAAARLASASYNDAANTIRLNGYALVDLRASYPVNDKIEVYGRVENLFDRFYETTYRYGTLGRAFYAGIRARY